MPLTSNLSDFKRVSRHFAQQAANLELRSIFPGYVVAPGDCLFPASINVDRPYSSFKVSSGNGAETSLCFSKLLFIGRVKGEQGLVDLSQFAEYSQSSCDKHARNLGAGATGHAFSNNVHTLREKTPWWRADFPSYVRVTHIFFYHRADWHVIKGRHIRISGLDDAGTEVPIYHPERKSFRVKDVPARLEAAADALGALLTSVPAEDAEAYSVLVTDAIDALKAAVERVMPKKKGLLIDSLKGLFGKKPLPNESFQGLSGKERAAIVDKLLKAANLALGGAKDFGCDADEGLDIGLPDVGASQIRFRVYGPAPGLGGARLFDADGQQIAILDAQDLKFRYQQPPYSCRESYRLGLFSQIHSRRHDLGQVHKLRKVKVWNLNRQQAANTLFLQIAVRSSDDHDWTTVYDHGAPYRHVCQILDLANMLISSDITSAYTRLLGKMFTQYRRTQLMTPVARLFRNRKELNDAIFEGSDEMSATRYAAPLKLGKHGLGVPIAFRDQKMVMEQLVEMREKIRALGYKPLLMYGTLLGAIREKDFIPHDDDIDLAILLEGVGPDELNDECSRMITVLNEAGIKATRGALHSPLIHCRRPPITYDIFILGQVGDKVYWPHKALAVVPERADIFLPLTTIEFKGELFDAPRNPQAVCEARYGSNWHVPNPAFEW